MNSWKNGNTAQKGDEVLFRSLQNSHVLEIIEGISIHETSQEEPQSERGSDSIRISRFRTPGSTSIQGMGKEGEAILKEFQKSGLKMCDNFR